MKKVLFLGAAAALMMSLSSCDENFVIGGLEEGLLGNASVVIDGEGYYNGTDTVTFSSSLADIFGRETEDTIHFSTLSLCANVDLANENLSFPFLAYQLRDTTTGVYPMETILTTQRLRNFNFDSIVEVLMQPSGFNCVVIAVSDTAWYISNSGNLNVSDFPSVGHNLEGTFSNIGAYYFTISDVERINENMDAEIAAGTFSLDNYFHPVTINGQFSSRRYVIIHDLVQWAFTEGNLTD